MDSSCSDTGNECECGASINRRDLLQIAGACAGTFGLAHLGNAGVVEVESREQFENLIPADKNLDKAWLDSLVTRSDPEIYKGWEQELKYIGMPVGGVGCGQLYLGGDGRLWLWDIFKCNYRREPDHGQRIDAFTLGGHYANPVPFGEQYTRWNGANVNQGFAIRIAAGSNGFTRTLDHVGFPDVTFRGEYPVGRVNYQDNSLPVTVHLEAFSPFIPLNSKDSGLPATVMSFRVTNTSEESMEVELAGWLQNATCPYVKDQTLGRRRNRISLTDERVSLLQTVESIDDDSAQEATAPREDILFADFESGSNKGWTAEGAAFSQGPYKAADLPTYIQLKDFQGDYVVNSHDVRDPRGGGQHKSREQSRKGDRLVGVLTSDQFTIDRNFITFLISGGNHNGKTCIKLLVDEKVVASKTGQSDHQMRQEAFDVREYQGKQARLQIVDEVSGSWGNICVDHIVFTDKTSNSDGIDMRHGFGSMALSVLNHEQSSSTLGCSFLPINATGEELFDHLQHIDLNPSDSTFSSFEEKTLPLNEQLVGAIGGAFELGPGESKTLDFAITWFFPDYNEVDRAPGFLSRLEGFSKLRRHYSNWFKSAGEVADYLSKNRERLLGDTRLWNQVWYDSTLPHWLLDRTFLTIDCAATQMLHWFDSGRLYGWEGVDCCPGTCTHVWHYAQGLARIFPDLERSFRKITDYGIAFNNDSGLIGSRAENHNSEATDGQAGTILRVYREHLMSLDDTLLRDLWPRIKKSIQFLMAKDPKRQGLLEGAQPHTLDAAWYGPMSWVSSLYLAAVAAGAEMAREMNDVAFSDECNKIRSRGKENIAKTLFNGEYFIHRPDPQFPKAIRSGNGCHIDQVLGQAWAHQVGLPRIIPKKETASALTSLWRYNFAPDAGRYAIKHREIEQAFRWYAMHGEAGLLMCTWPRGGAEQAIPGERLRPEKNPEVWTGPGGYFNECMNGFEYQVAAHMIYEGDAGSTLVEKGLAITRAIHDRYAAAKRNPYNEIECSDHYARSMASYGVFLAACGFEYHGPQARIGFAPRISPNDFRAPFTSAAGWGTYRQVRSDSSQASILRLRWGTLELKKFVATVPREWSVTRCKVTLDNQVVDAFCSQIGTRVEVTLEGQQQLQTNSILEIQLPNSA